MKKLLLIAVLLSVTFVMAQEKTVTLPSNSLVVVKTLNELSGEELITGDYITCVVAEDVVVDDVVVIKANTDVVCLVDDSEESGMVGQGGNLRIEIQSTKTVANKTVTLNGKFRVKGESSVGEKVAIGVILCPLALLSSGDEAIIPAGTQVRAFTVGEAKVVIKEAE